MRILLTTSGFESSFWGEKPEAVKQPEKVDAKAEKPLETINIFSVASGHLYERFLKIMMLSVVKNTKSPVKFWFVKNFLSPKFKVWNKYSIILVLHRFSDQIISKCCLP